MTASRPSNSIRFLRASGALVPALLAFAGCSGERPPSASLEAPPAASTAPAAELASTPLDAGAKTIDPSDGGDAGEARVGDVLAPLQLKPSWLTRDGATLYWLLDSPGEGAILKMPVAGGEATAVAKNLVQPDALRVDGSDLYWLAYGEGAGIRRYSMSNGTTTTLVSTTAPVPIRQIAVDKQWLYWTDGPAGAVRRIPRAGGSPSTYANGIEGPADLTVEASGLYVVASGEEGRILRVHGEGGDLEVLASKEPLPGSLFVGNDAVYWIDAGTFDTANQRTLGAGVRKVKKSGGAPFTVATVENASQLFVDDDGTVFFALDRDLMRIAGNAGPTRLATLPGAIRGIRADAQWLYVADIGTPEKQYADGAIRRLAKR